MSIVAKQHASVPSAPAPLSGLVAVPPHRSPVRSLRTDAAHVTVSCGNAPVQAAALTWTTCVTPANALFAAQAITETVAAASIVQASARDAAALPGHSTSAQYGLERSGAVAVGSSIRRQRFYAAQWRRAVEPEFGRLLNAQGRRLQWIGWDRSLPRLYLPVEQLTQAVVDLLRLTMQWSEHRGGQSQPACLRVGWQIGATQTLVLVLAHPRLRLSAAALAVVNATHELLPAAEPQRSELEALRRVRRSLHAMGGGLTASHSQEGGGLFRLSLPVDDRGTLVRSWLEQLPRSGAHPADAAADARRVTEPTQIRTQQIRMFAVGRMQPGSVADLAAADAQLQSRAGREDFVYRAAHGRWLWLTTLDRLPDLPENHAWRHHLVGRWNCSLGTANERGADMVARLGSARAIAAGMEAVLGRRVPPIDVLELAPPRSRRLRIDRATELRTDHRALRPRVDTIGIPTAKPHAPALARQRRWRYPI